MAEAAQLAVKAKPRLRTIPTRSGVLLGTRKGRRARKRPAVDSIPHSGTSRKQRATICRHSMYHGTLFSIFTAHGGPGRVADGVDHGFTGDVSMQERHALSSRPDPSFAWKALNDARALAQDPNRPQLCRPLRVRRKRPRDSCAANQRDELAPLQSIELHLQPLARDAA
jgi:hypothetical protein